MSDAVHICFVCINPMSLCSLFILPTVLRVSSRSLVCLFALSGVAYMLPGL